MPQQLPLRISEIDGYRALFFGNQMQGGCALSPGAEAVDPDLAGPGPVTIAAYQAGWLHAGLYHPSGLACMIGLGAGSGVVSLLYNFPHLYMEVIEISQEVVDQAIEAFPLLGHYLSQGRLNIRVEDANTAEFHGYDIGFADAYIGENNLIMGYLQKFQDACECLWFNAIDTPHGPTVTKICESLQNAGRPPLVARVHLGQNMPRDNYLITDQQFFPSWNPYPDLEGPWVDYARQKYHEVGILLTAG